MLESVPAPAAHRGLWLASAGLLVGGTVFLVFGLGWSLVASLAELGAGAASGIAGFGWQVFGGSCLAILAGLFAYAALRRLEADGRAIVQIDFERPVVGFHGRRASRARCRVEARISVTTRRAVTAVVRDRADDIARAAAEALAFMGPRAAHHPDRLMAEQAIAEVVNRSLRARVVRSIRLHTVRMAPAR